MAVGQSYYASVEKISVADGLPDSTVYTIVKDPKGFIWLGTPKALARYDGYEFRTYNRFGGPGQNIVLSGAGTVFIDSKERIWVGSWGEGLALYDRYMNLIGHFVMDTEDPAGLGSNMVQSIFEDADGDIWIGTNGGGLGHYQEASGHFKNYLHKADNPASLSHNRIWDIAQTPDGDIWVATSSGLSRLDKQGNRPIRRYGHDPDKADSLDHILTRTLEVAGGKLWVGTETGFGEFDPESGRFRQIPLFVGETLAAITDILADDEGGVWVGTQKGLFRYQIERSALTPLTGDQGVQLFPHNDIRDLLIDDSGVLWVATRYAGLIKVNLSANSFNFHDRYMGASGQAYPVDKIYSMHLGQDNIVWMGTSEGLLKMDMTTRRLVRVDGGPGVVGYGVAALTQDNDGVVWLGGPFGLLSYKQGEQFVNRNDILSDVAVDHVLSLRVDGRGDLWIGTADDGLLRRSPKGTLKHFRHDALNNDTVSGDNISAIFEDRLGRIWVGTNGSGANRYDARRDRFIRYQSVRDDPSSLISNVVNVIYQTRDSVMWFGTPKGLDMLDDANGHFVHVTGDNRLSDDNVKGMVEDFAGDLWISTGKGLSQFKRESGYFLNFTQRDSLTDVDLLVNSVVRINGEQLLFGAYTGVYEIVPTQVKLNTHLPEVAITEVWVDNVAIVQNHFRPDKALILGHETKSIRLQFSALDYQNPERNRYSFRLSGFDSQWSDPSTSRSATYTSLNPGRYEFDVRGSNNANQWNPSSARLILVIKQPWWEKWWVRTLIVLCTATLVYLAYRRRVHVIAVQKQQLEQEVAERTREILAQKNELEEAHQQLNKQSDALQASNRELSATLQQTAEFQDQLVEKEKMAALGNMVAGIAHEINTPIGLGVTATTLMQDRLMAIKQSLADKKLSATQLEKYLLESDESLGIIYRNLDRAAELIGSFKQVSVDQSSDEGRTFELNRLIDEVLVSLRPQLKQVNHQVVVHCSGAIVIKNKPGALSQILINLIMNSLLHAFEGIEKGQMTIIAQTVNDDCLLTYRDNGNGVSDKVKSKIFEPFTTTRRGKGGSGLGMHLVYNLANQALSGGITMNADVAQGVEFQLRFPISDKPRQKVEQGSGVSQS